MAAANRLLNRIDLNLLKVFRAVYDRGQTTAAAQFLGLTQPAVSQALKRLRDIVGDPLFVPGASGMQPTARAVELSAPVAEALAAIEQALARSPQFDPAIARRRFRLGMLDYGVMALAPGLAAVLSREAPGISVDISHVPSDSAARLLLADHIDIVTGPFAHPPASLERTPVSSDQYVLVARRGHKALKGPLEDALSNGAPHVDVAYDTSEGGGIDAALQAFGFSRRKAMQVPLFGGACFIAGASDFLAIVPRRFAEVHAGVCGIGWRALPAGFPPLEICALVHRRNSADPGLRWLLETLTRTARGSGFGSLAAPEEKKAATKAATKSATKRGRKRHVGV